MRTYVFVSALVSAVMIYAPTAAARGPIFEIGGANVMVPVPKGYCYLGISHPVDRVYRQMVRELTRGTLKLHAIYADCEQLRDCYSGAISHIRDIVYVSAPKKALFDTIRLSQKDFALLVAKSEARRARRPLVDSQNRNWTAEFKRLQIRIKKKSKIRLGTVKYNRHAAYVAAVYSMEGISPSSMWAHYESIGAINQRVVLVGHVTEVSAVDSVRAAAQFRNILRRSAQYRRMLDRANKRR